MEVPGGSVRKGKTYAGNHHIAGVAHDGHYENAIFLGDVCFTNMAFADAANFKGARFRGNVTFDKAISHRGLDFSGAIFEKQVTFDGMSFQSGVKFNRSIFKGIALFNSCSFERHVYFNNAKFEVFVTFSCSKFLVETYFQQVYFLGPVSFLGAKFDRRSVFSGSYFGGDIANFKSVRFEQGCNFRKAKFSSNSTDYSDSIFRNITIFNEITFSGIVIFDRSSWEDRVKFTKLVFHDSASFINLKMTAPSEFSEVEFRAEPPNFNGAELHEGMILHGVKWPPPPNSPVSAARHVRAYARLKLEMERLNRHEDEITFFALEMAARRVEIGPRSIHGTLLGIYGHACDYGRSYARPLGLFLYLMLVSPVVLASAFGDTPADFRKAVFLSVSNALSAFALKRDFFNADELLNFPNWIKLFSVAHSIVSLALLFLFGLGLRNRFRLR